MVELEMDLKYVENSLGISIFCLSYSHLYSHSRMGTLVTPK